MLYQDILGRRCSIVLKKAYACWLSFVENFFTMHVKTEKLLEKSKRLEQILREFWFYFGEDVVSFKKIAFWN
jgi:hypothetical protein